MNEFLMNNTSSMMDFIDEASTCREEIEPVVYPVELEREFAQLHQFCASNISALEASKAPHIKDLVKIVRKLDTKMDSMSRVSLGAFLKE